MNKTFEEFLIDSYNKSPYRAVTSFKSWMASLTPYTWISLSEQWSKESAPIDPAQARQKLDCIARMREALKKADHFIGNLDPEKGNYTYYALADVLTSIEQALKEESEK